MLHAFHLTSGGSSRGISVPGRRGIYRGIALVLSTLAGAVAAVGPNNALNDTGVTTYGNATSNGLTSEPVDYPGQDTRYGRDAAAAAGKLPKVGGGSKGFDFTKISNSGTVLPAAAALGPGASDWGCTYDNVTGLMWEVKVNDATHLRHMDWTYTWYDSNTSTNGGSVGVPGSGSCRTIGRCDTEKFVVDVNAAGLCGRRDWRMPTLKELESIVDFSSYSQAIDSTWFPNTLASYYFWSASAAANNPSYAWPVNFRNGQVGAVILKGNGSLVRLVRWGR